MSKSLTDLSERTGLTRAAISRLENGWNLNRTLETLYRYTEVTRCRKRGSPWTNPRNRERSG